ncbi:hypothetical protein [Halostella pelagica]|uniref:hypothetical protein n=1 Tax=Halostella pelagica TaxID=2583824 RepID=UPI001386901D|nr:hypothetical protein [Halostella pelagica]
MLNVDKNPRETGFVVSKGDPVISERDSADSTVEVKLYEVELAALSGRTRRW